MFGVKKLLASKIFWRIKIFGAKNFISVKKCVFGVKKLFWLKIILPLLRVITLSILIIFIANPIIKWSFKKSYTPRVNIIIDNSLSMKDQFGNVEKILRKENFSILKSEKYCARRFGISAWLANKILRTQNTFNILAVRK